jgi:hypothetical protein
VALGRDLDGIFARKFCFNGIQRPLFPPLLQLPPHTARSIHAFSQDYALFSFLRWSRGARAEHSTVVKSAWNRPRIKPNLPDRLVEHALQVTLGERRTFQVLLCPDLLGDHDGLLVLYGGHLLLAQALLGSLVVPQVELRTDENNGDVGRMMVDLRVPLCM